MEPGTRETIMAQTQPSTIPPGYHSATPFLTVKDIVQSKAGTSVPEG
jgi:hypothetical protein